MEGTIKDKAKKYTSKILKNNNEIHESYLNRAFIAGYNKAKSEYTELLKLAKIPQFLIDYPEFIDNDNPKSVKSKL